jgi:hypothetical protein
MKLKISAISVVCIFLITGLTTLSAVGFEEGIAQNTSRLCYLHDTSTVSGSVWGRSSPFNPVVGPLSDAKVELCGDEYYCVSTDVNGEFVITEVNYGVYTIKVSKEGYKNYEDNIEIDESTVNLEPIILAGKKAVVYSFLELMCKFSYRSFL